MIDTITAKAPAVQLRGSLFTLSVLQLNTYELSEIDRELKSLVYQAPRFFEQAPIVIDLQKVMSASDETIDFESLSQTLRSRGMVPVGVRGGTQEQHKAAKAGGLAVLSLAKQEEPQLATRQKSAASSDNTADKTSKTQAASGKKSILVTKPVRSGQQVYAEQCDLIVVAAVSQGAELLADGNIHIYGPLRGRALAGVNGDSDARIFCQSLEAELVAIAGRYVVNESLIKAKHHSPHQIYLDGDTLKIVTL